MDHRGRRWWRWFERFGNHWYNCEGQNEHRSDANRDGPDQAQRQLAGGREDRKIAGAGDHGPDCHPRTGGAHHVEKGWRGRAALVQCRNGDTSETGHTGMFTERGVCRVRIGVNLFCARVGADRPAIGRGRIKIGQGAPERGVRCVGTCTEHRDKQP